MKLLLKKLNEISKEIGQIKKEGYNEFHKYKYVTESDVIEALKPHLNAHGVVIVPSIKEVRQNGDITTVLVDYTIGCVDSDDKITCQWAGTGQDKGDKGLYKALTGAEKYFLMKTFMISSNDDPENETHHQPRQHQSVVKQELQRGDLDMVIKWGKDKDKRVRDLTKEQAKRNLDYWNDRLAKEGKPASAQMMDYLTSLELLLQQPDGFMQDVPPLGDDDIRF